ncbi:hypothetical protein BD414DRAFT_503441 [Trametes punicea]|nr:hypothetical protein BD414DRAFT_503441 [Trametes punicea]
MSPTMPPRRHRSTSNAPTPANPQNAPLPTQRTQTPGSATQRELGMRSAVYESNMKVLLRREPSITAIIDQFSHVCLYHYSGQKWEKHGYEGSMFLYEKSTYPPYGFYILNRMGTDDFVRPIYPEDDMEITGEYLMCRFYPDFTKTRLDMGLPYPIPPEHRAAFDLELSKRIPPEEREKEREKKGRSIILGLWMYPTDAREPLNEVMMRVHSYVKRGLPYPDEYRYGPGRPPPPNPHLRTGTHSSLQTPSQDQVDGSRKMQPNSGPYSGRYNQPQPSLEQARIASSGAGSDIDKLFAKLLTPSASAPFPSAPSTGPPTGVSVHDFHAALGGQDRGRGSVAPSQSAPGSQPAPRSVSSTVPEPEPPRGLALLDSIFASVTPAGSSISLNDAATSSSLPSQPEEINIVSPKPTSSALPQILNQDVISSLLGLGSDSRASSAAPSSAGSRRSGQNRYEGDNEFSEGDFVPDELTSRANVNAEDKRRPAGVPTFSVRPAASSESEDDGTRPTSSRRVPGDVTPRPPLGGTRLPLTSPPHPKQHSQAASLSAPNLKGESNGNPGSDTPSSAPRARPLVPFGANSDLWPYPRAPLDDRSFDNDDVVELDFTDTRALSDPTLFSSRLKEKQHKKGKGKKTKKEREEEKARERAEIEKSWDMPVGNRQGQPSHTQPAAGKADLSTTHGTTSSSPTKVPKQTRKPTANGVTDGVSLVNDHSRNGTLDSNAAKDAVLSCMSAKGVAAGQTIAKNEFVRELLTLIHTDSRFIDGLYQDYLSRAA